MRIESTSRWDALALAARLARYRWYIVEPDDRHWDVYVTLAPGAALPEDLPETIRSWRHERKPAAATVYVDDRYVVAL